MSIRLAVAGYYGCGNLGDEAVLAGILDSFRDRAQVERACFTVLSADPARTRALHGVRAIERMGLTSLRRALGESDALLLGGGSLLQDVTSLRSLLYYFWVARIGLAAGKPLVLYAQGMGPLRRAVSRRLVRSLVERAAVVTVRDAGSKALIAELGSARPVTVTADPAFCVLGVSDEELQRAKAEAALPGGDWIGMVVRPVRGTTILGRRIDDFARAVAASTGLRVVLLPFHPQMDWSFAQRVAESAPEQLSVVRLPESVPLAMGLVGGAQVMVGMRLHACIFAVARGVPVVSLSYDPKVTAFMQEAGLTTYNVKSEALDVQNACVLVSRAIREREALRARLLDTLTLLRERAYQNVELTMRALGAAAGNS